MNNFWNNWSFFWCFSIHFESKFMWNIKKTCQKIILIFPGFWNGLNLKQKMCKN